jgi:hypothetical protein
MSTSASSETLGSTARTLRRTKSSTGSLTAAGDSMLMSARGQNPRGCKLARKRAKTRRDSPVRSWCKLHRKSWPTTRAPPKSRRRPVRRGARPFLRPSRRHRPGRHAPTRTRTPARRRDRVRAVRRQHRPEAAPRTRRVSAPCRRWWLRLRPLGVQSHRLRPRALRRRRRDRRHGRRHPARPSGAALKRSRPKSRRRSPRHRRHPAACRLAPRRRAE